MLNKFFVNFAIPAELNNTTIKNKGRRENLPTFFFITLCILPYTLWYKPQ